MKPSAVQQLLRPWQKYRDQKIFYGLTKSGNKRWSLTTKQGNKDFYKGTNSTGVGSWTNKGQYRINWEKVRTYVVPAGVDSSDLKPFVCPTAPSIKNAYAGFAGATDGKLHLRKVMEFIKYGTEESPEMARKDGWKERG
ncbi:54S ribosomal protein L27, mitochondrial [Wickerhamiella sorbophila]|uniref:54S ribosomal protein L27, mitochondrial n=1 Tax=Wickerhamiella sorbophila TaxID=45607 RepID=A0A2T0FDB4_9ASCO|nr:54S ribosomal protein L27, mitochondrial [Wickerhamiella sorbophila]PRT52957.1 54S ribosomal protein L27, mitochondrial [Wickerhamiella sorbophila]